MSGVGLTIYGVTAPRIHPGVRVRLHAGSSYGFLSAAWPFGAVEAIWSLIALRRYLVAARESPQPG